MNDEKKKPIDVLAIDILGGSPQGAPPGDLEGELEGEGEGELPDASKGVESDPDAILTGIEQRIARLRGMLPSAA